MNILMIGAHPDDIELGCAGFTIRAQNNGHNVTWLVMTTGDYKPEDRETRIAEQNSVLKIIGMGLKLEQCQLADNRLHEELKGMIEIIERSIQKNGIDAIFTHSKNDTHHDHRAVYQASYEAGRNIDNILSYEEIISNNFRPQLFVDITEYIDIKINIVECHKSQRGKVSLQDEAIESLAYHRGAQFNQIPGQYYEAFEIIKMGDSFVNL